MAEDKESGSSLSAEVQAALNSFISRQGGLQAALDKLWDDNFNLRRKNDAYKTENEALRDRVPAEGALVLSKADAARWEAYRQAGDPDAVKAVIAERDALRSKAASLEKENTLRAVAEAEGWKIGTLKKHAGNYDFELREVEEEGQKKHRAFVNLRDGDKVTSKPAREELSDLLPALSAEAGAPAGTQYVKQAAPGKAPAAKTYDDIRAGVKERAEANKFSPADLAAKLGRKITAAG